MFVRVKFFGIESKSKMGFEKGNMHVVITIESITIVSSILAFQPKLIHMDSIKKFRSFIKSWRYVPIIVVIISVRGVGDNKGENNC
jgi:hypothetical protein